MTRAQRLPTSVPKELQLAFAGYLHEVASVGGSTVKDYLQRLPTALALYHSRFQSGYRQFTLDPEVKQAIKNMAVEIPPKRQTMRDPLTVDTLIKISQDQQLNSDVRSAIIVAFYLGFRPINIVSVKRSRAKKQQHDRPLKWSDLRQLRLPNDQIGFEVVVRKEKTATKHSGDFAPKLLLPAEPGMPCPVDAILDVATRHGTNPDTVLFPNITDKHLQNALQKHAEDGQRLTPYSIRIGAATAIAAAGLPMEFQRRQGNWKCDKTVDTYVRNSLQKWKRTQAALRAISTPNLKEDCAKSRTLPHNTRKATRQSGPQPQVRRYPDGKTDILLIQHNRRQWRGYFYEPRTGERTQRYRERKPRLLMEYETFRETELPYMMKNTTAVSLQSNGQIDADIQHVMKQLASGVRYPKRAEIQSTNPKPAATGEGGN